MDKAVSLMYNCDLFVVIGYLITGLSGSVITTLCGIYLIYIIDDAKIHHSSWR